MGIWYREQFQGRLKILRQLAEILELLMSEVRYGKSTLPECCRYVGERVQEPFGGCLVHIHDEMQKNTGNGFYEVFSEGMGECLEGFPLAKEDKEAFLHFASKGSFADGAMQLRWMEQSREMLGSIISGLEQETVQKGRIAVALGAMSGLLLVIVLL